MTSAWRRCTAVASSWLFNCRFALALAFAACISAKLTHILAHINAISTQSLLLWGASFFLQDTVLLLLLRPLLGGFTTRPYVRFITPTLALAIIALVLAMAGTFVSFYITAGSELQWRNVALAGDSSSWGTLVAGLFSCAMVVAVLLVLAAVLQNVCDGFFAMALDILTWPARWLINRYWPSKAKTKYQSLPTGDVEGGDEEDRSEPLEEKPPVSKKQFWIYVAVGWVLFIQLAATVLRPSETSLIHLSWTLPLMPLTDLARSPPSLVSLRAGKLASKLDGHSALAKPLPFSWLPKGAIPGFSDWYNMGGKHYSAAQDPLRLSNLDGDVLEPLREKLANVSIRNVVLVKLESTRKDVFPLKKDGLIWHHLAQTFDNATLPDDVYKKLANLTPTANFLTGDFEDGFEHHKGKTARGGLNCNNDFTTSSYTLKSITGTHCGLFPMVRDFNVEAGRPIYQPCLPHILSAFNNISDEGGKWKSVYMQSVTSSFDHQEDLTPKLGFDTIIDKEWLWSDDAYLGKVNMSEINYYGMPEVAVEDYLRDAFASAKKNNERVFVSHLTSTTHHGFGLPEGVDYVRLTNDDDLDNLSKYLNAVSYVDSWLGRILKLLDEEGVADETLLVFVGDHGLSLPERGSITPYNNPHVANQHIPLVFSHPQLPHIDINDAVSSVQILPTILDLLVETGSLGSAQSLAAKDLLDNYEGQSLIRPPRTAASAGDQISRGGWQFTVLNPGGSSVSIRDARQPQWHLTVPVWQNQEWRFANLEKDEHENDPLRAFELRDLMAKLDEDVAMWVEEAAVVGKWWVSENHKRWSKPLL